MNIPTELKYTREHEWVSVKGNIATVGVTEYAQGELGDVVFVELPAVSAKVKALQPFGTIEAVKAVSELFSPVSGEVIEINNLLESNPMAVNHDPYGNGWMIKIKINDPNELDKLLSALDYHKLVE
ncbi:MAG: glycine cleavage system protein GcvH [candidate division Zixibacteria bacterium]|nr:glycine cleavage system protein GcvH [candidate division Zixibacteria bacterium]